MIAAYCSVADRSTFNTVRFALLRQTALAGGVIAGMMVMVPCPAAAQTVPGVPVLDAGNSFTTFQTGSRQFEWIGVADDNLGNAANYLGNYNYRTRTTATLLNPAPTIDTIIPNVAPGPGWVRQELYITRTDQRITDYTGVFNAGLPRFSPAAFLSNMPTFSTNTYISTISVTNGGFDVGVGATVNVGDLLVLKSLPGVHPSTQNHVFVGGTVTADYRTYLQGSINTGGLVNTGTIQTTGLYNHANGNRSEVFIQGPSEIGVRLLAQGNTDIIFQDFNGSTNFTAKWTGRLDAAAGKDIALRAGAGTLVYTGPSSLGLEGFRVQTGSLQIGDGGTSGQTPVDTGKTLTLDAGTRVIFDRSDDVSVGAIIAGAGGLTKKNSNVLTLTGINTYTGPTLVEAGTLKIGAGGALNSASLITVNAGATFDFGAIDNPTVGSLGGTGGALTGGTGNLTVQMANGTTDSYAGTNPFGGFNSLVLSGNGTLNLTGNLNSNKAIAIDGGTLNLTGTNTLSGGITVNGKLVIGASGAAGGAGNTITTTGSVISFANGVNSATPININSNTTQLEVLAADSATQSGVISETAGPRGFEKIGTGTLTLAANNTYSGATTISAGTLQVDDKRNLGNDSATNSLVFNGGTLSSRADITMARSVVVNATGGTVSADNNTGALQKLVFSSGVQFLGGTLVKTGGGQLHVAGTGSGTGTLHVTDGALFVNSGSALGSASLRFGGTGVRTFSTTAASVAFGNAIALDTNVLISNETGTSLTLSGPISGTGSLQKTNFGTLNLTGANSFSGGVSLGSGALGVGSNTALGSGQAAVQTGTTLRAVANVTLANAIQISQGAFGVNQFTVDTNGFNMTLSGVISTTVPATEAIQPGLTKNGLGDLTLSGVNTYRGQTIINAGRLIVNGSIANTSSVTIADGAVLAGNAAIPNLTVMSGAKLTPGNSIGTVNIGGNLTLNAGSTTVIEIQQAQVDKINAGGTATLAGTLQLVALGGPYNFGTPYNFLTATGGINGTFSTVTTDAAFGVGVTSAVSYSANNAFVTLTAAPLVTSQSAATATANTVLGLTRTRNVTAVASALDHAVLSGVDVSSLFRVYNQPTREALAAAVNTLSGEVHTATSAAGLRVSDQFLRVMLDPFAIGRDGSLVGTSGPVGFTADLPGRKGAVSAPAPVRFEPTFHVWGATFGQIDRTKGDATGAGSSTRDIRDANIAVGADYRIAPGSVIGFALSGGQSRSELGRNLGSSNADIFQLGLYGATKIGALSLAGSLSYAAMQVETRRNVPALGLGTTADYSAHVWGGRLQAAYDLFSAGGFTVSPIAALQIQSVHTPNFRETNSFTGAAAGVTGRSHTNTALRSDLGLRITSVTMLGGRKTTLFTEIAWAHYFQRDVTFAASLTGIANTNFVIEGARSNRDAALFSAGADIQLTPTLTLGGRFDASASGNTTSFAGSGMLRASF